MRIFDENYNEISENDVDLSKGKLVEGTILRIDAAPIDNKNKWAWDDDDYEKIQVYVLNPEPEETADVINTEDTILDMMADHEYRLCILELGGEL